MQAGGITKTVDLVVEIKEREAIFNLEVGIIEKNKMRGENLEATITVNNLGNLKPVDITLLYAFKDMEGRERILQQETLAIEEQLQLTRIFRIPQDVETKNYILYAQLTYQNQTAFGSDVFSVIEEQQPRATTFNNIYLIILFILILLVVLFILIKMRKRKKPRKTLLEKLRKERDK